MYFAKYLVIYIISHMKCFANWLNRENITISKFDNHAYPINRTYLAQNYIKLKYFEKYIPKLITMVVVNSQISRCLWINVTMLNVPNLGSNLFLIIVNDLPMPSVPNIVLMTQIMTFVLIVNPILPTK